MVSYLFKVGTEYCMGYSFEILARNVYNRHTRSLANNSLIGLRTML